MTQIMEKHIEQVAGYLTLREASKQMGCTRNALYLWMKRNNIPCTRLGNSILVRPSDIIAYTPR